MYQVLYRKWRPKTFDDVVGQEHITRTLKNELKSGHVAHAYLFTGSRGTGKTSCAKILAKAVNCENPENGNPCGKCTTCEGIESGSILDVTEIDAASNNGVENIRMIREEAVFTPASAKYRVYIVDEVHMLSIGAFNALLKILEEPPEHVIFILATTEVHKIPVTILSRCQRFDFNRISLKDMSERIEYICKEENIEISHEAANLISKFSDGALRDALSILDQCRGKSEAISLETVLSTSGVSGSQDIFKIVRCIFDNDPKTIIKVVEDLYLKSKDMLRLCGQILECFRDIMIYSIAKDECDLLNYDIEKEFDLNNNALDLNKIVWYIDNLQDAYDQMQKGFNKKLELELCLVKLCGVSQNLDSKINLPKNEKQKESMPEIKADVSVPSEVTENDNEKAEEYSDSNEILNYDLKSFSLWNKVIDTLIKQGNSKSMSIAFKGSKAYEKGNYILIDSSSDLAFELLREPENRNKMRNAIMEVTGKCYKLGPYKKDKKESGESDKLDELTNIVKNAGISINLN